MQLKWTKGYTGGLSSLYQSDLECYIDGQYKYAIKREFDDEDQRARWYVYRVELTCYVDDAIWDCITGEDAEDGSEIGYALYYIGDSTIIEMAKDIAQIHFNQDNNLNN